MNSVPCVMDERVDGRPGRWAQPEVGVPMAGTTSRLADEHALKGQLCHFPAVPGAQLTLRIVTLTRDWVRSLTVYRFESRGAKTFARFRSWAWAELGSEPQPVLRQSHTLASLVFPVDGSLSELRQPVFCSGPVPKREPDPSGQWAAPCTLYPVFLSVSPSHHFVSFCLCNQITLLTPKPSLLAPSKAAEVPMAGSPPALTPMQCSPHVYYALGETLTKHLCRTFEASFQFRIHSPCLYRVPSGTRPSGQYRDKQIGHFL